MSMQLLCPSDANASQTTARTSALSHRASHPAFTSFICYSAIVRWPRFGRDQVFSSRTLHWDCI
ncbi:hypothetical protein P692DRAFT_20827992, partial [Suillus brevipes Sb2]